MYTHSLILLKSINFSGDIGPPYILLEVLYQDIQLPGGIYIALHKCYNLLEALGGPKSLFSVCSTVLLKAENKDKVVSWCCPFTKRKGLERRCYLSCSVGIQLTHACLCFLMHAYTLLWHANHCTWAVHSPLCACVPGKHGYGSRLHIAVMLQPQNLYTVSREKNNSSNGAIPDPSSLWRGVAARLGIRLHCAATWIIPS